VEEKNIIDYDRLVHNSLSFSSSSSSSSSSSAPLFLLTSSYEVSSATNDCSVYHSIYITLALSSSYQVIPCDLAVSATGVIPNTEFLLRSSSSSSSGDCHCPLAMDEEGNLIVDDYFRCCSSSFSSSAHPIVENIFSAGDCCVYRPQFRSTEFFFQMKLWTQVS
jgi:hypothetical protein